MRLRNLLEYDNVDAAKKEIIATVSGLSADNEQDAQLLDKIYQVLNSDGMCGKIAYLSNAYQKMKIQYNNYYKKLPARITLTVTTKILVHF